MLTRMRRSKAFTLVELLIVILLIAILMAIAIPNFLGSRQKAGDRTAQQTLRTAVSSVKAFASDVDDFSSVTEDGLTSSEPNIAWSDAAVDEKGNSRPVAFAVSNGTATGNAGENKVITLTTPGADGACWSVSVHLDEAPDMYGVRTGQDECAATALTTAGTTATSAIQPREFPERP